MDLFIIDRPEAPWGDYGDVLLHGLAGHLGRAADGLLRLERTGPFVPPISFPGAATIVVTDEMRRRIDASGLSGFFFLPVHKARIVELDWHRWDTDAPEPPEFPPETEPENYILGRPHSPALAERIGDLWELAAAPGARAERVQTGNLPWEFEIRLLRDSWSGADFFRAEDVLYRYVSDRARAWLLQAVPGFVRFREAPLG